MAPNWKANILSRIGMGSSHGVGLFGKTILRGGQITATYLMKVINESLDIISLYGKIALFITQPYYCLRK